MIITENNIQSDNKVETGKKQKTLSRFIQIDNRRYYNTGLTLAENEVPMMHYNTINGVDVYTLDSFGSELNQIYIENDGKYEIYANMKYYQELDKVNNVSFSNFNTIKLSASDRAMNKIKQDLKPRIVESSVPYIYIYGNVELDIKLYIEDGYVTESIPVYNKGWHVKARNGKINKKYDYLYYENSSKIIPKFNTTLGWCFKRDEFACKFSGILRNYNLNEKEICDFIKGWLPLLTEDCYTAYPIINDEINPIVEILTSKDILQNRLWFIFEKGRKDVKIPAIKPFNRCCNNILEWGGIML